MKERLSKAILTGFTLCISGSILLTIFSPSSAHASNPLLGDFVEFLAMICAAYYSVSIKYLSGRYSPFALIALQGVSGTLFFAPFILFNELPVTHNSNALLNILYLGTVVTFGAYGLYNYALTKVSVLTAASFSNLIPIFSLLLSAILLGERLNSTQWLSISIVFLVIIISQKHKSSTLPTRVEIQSV